jgi:DNA polymerase-3 subunit delta'
VSDTDQRADPWSAVVGQPAAVESLRGAAVQPVHAYLLVGQPGWGTGVAARSFAAALLSAGLEPAAAERAVTLALAGQHPDLHFHRVAGATLRDEEAADIVSAASMAPVEGARKVLILEDFHKAELMGPKLLKTIEEPSNSTVFVILADDVPDGLVTIASRAVRVDFGPVPVSVLVDQLVADGIDSAIATSAAQAAGGDLERARVLVSDERLALRWSAWRETPGRLTGTGSTAWQQTRELLAHIDDAQASLDTKHEAETEALRVQIETYGQRNTPLKHLADRQKREIRRHRTDELRFGLAALASVYRDALATVDDPEPLIAAIGSIGAAAEALIRNPNETLLLQATLAGLPHLR